MLFHVKQNAFERELAFEHATGSTVIEHSNGAALFSPRNKKGGLLAAFLNQNIPCGLVDR
jgi:hypothetical protein